MTTWTPTYEPLRNRHGNVVTCMHKGCNRPAVRIVSYERPEHRQFRGQTHDCCSVHSRPSRGEE